MDETSFGTKETSGKRTKTYGRTTILANYTEDQILSASEKDLDNIIIEILQNSKGIHEINEMETNYLKGYYYGNQDIQYKVKKTREEINNKSVENWLYSLVEFKKAYLLGQPIKYVQIGSEGDNTPNKEISVLNSYVKYENKKSKDMEIFQDMLVCGRGYRYINKDPKGKEDEAPFEIINCPVDRTEVVYSSKLGNEQLFAYIVTPMERTFVVTNDNGQEVTQTEDYNDYQVYLRDRILSYTDKGGTLAREGDAVPLLYGEHIITEYYLNKKRISLTEICKDLLDDINYLESLDKDDMEQFVNSIMIITNAQFTEEDLDNVKRFGAMSIKSTDQNKASVDLLQNRLKAQDTQTYYNRLLTALHNIAGVPMASDNGNTQYGDTGVAKLTGQGFMYSTVRLNNEMTMFNNCDLNSLKVILAICRNVESSEIKTLRLTDIEGTFQIDMSSNLLTKAQGLQILYSCDVPRKYANAIVNLFSDPNAVTQDQEKMFGEQISQLNAKNSSTSSFGGNNEGIDNNFSTTNDENKANAQNNRITELSQKDSQMK